MQGLVDVFAMDHAGGEKNAVNAHGVVHRRLTPDDVPLVLPTGTQDDPQRQVIGLSLPNLPLQGFAARRATFEDGNRMMSILEKVIESASKRSWVEV